MSFSRCKTHWQTQQLKEIRTRNRNRLCSMNMRSTRYWLMYYLIEREAIEDILPSPVPQAILRSRDCRR
jgi:hypothetical protein